MLELSIELVQDAGCIGPNSDARVIRLWSEKASAIQLIGGVLWSLAERNAPRGRGMRRTLNGKTLRFWTQLVSGEYPSSGVPGDHTHDH